jgi:hypothetical protein
MIYRLGSKGDGVSEIQLALKLAGYNVTMDGDYRAKTREAVVAFQRSRGIGADGIVGPKTLALLKEVLVMGKPHPQPLPEGEGSATAGKGAVVITNGYIWQHVTRCANRAIRYIAIHYTAGTTSRRGQAMQVRQVFLQRSASADFVVDDDTIVQINPDLRNYYCWAVGDAKNKWTGGGRLYGVATNKNTISIEICSTLRQGTSAQIPNHEGWSLSPQAVEQARRLVRHLMSLYGIPKERVVRHYDITGKLCPGIVGWNDGPKYDAKGRQTASKSDSKQWQAFWNSL